MAINDEELELPRPFGPYTLLRRLAVGGMAEVYVAKAKGIGGFEKLVAIKVIHPRYSEDDHFIQMLVEEAKISVLLTHVNIAQTFDLGCIDDTYYIVMEFIEGADTYRVIRRAAEMKKAIPVDLAAYLVAEMCNGLDYAHRKRDAQGRPLGIVHRDISPQNVLVSYAGEVKIVDFGIAKAALRGGQTEAGVIKGKYYYMSPEQAWGDPMDHRSDIFSTGVVLYELLTGRMLYQEDNVPLLLDKVRKAEITPPTARRGSVPHALSEIVMRALRKEPIDRYQSAAEMGQALMQFVYAQSPTFSASRLAELMSTLFPNEAQRHSALIKLPSLETSLDRPSSESAGPPSIASDVLPVMKPEEFALPREASVIFELGDDEEEDATRNDVLPFRRAAARAAAQQASASPSEEPGRPTLRPPRARETVQIRDEGRVSAPAVRADGTWAAPASSGAEAQVAPAIEAITTSPQRSAEEPTTSNESSPADDWEDETLLRGHGRAAAEEQDFEGDSTLVDSGEVMKQMRAALAQADSMRGRTVESGRGRVHVKQPGGSRPAVAAVPAPAPAASAKPRSVPPPARLPPRPASAPPPPMARAIPGPATSPGGVAAPIPRPVPPPVAIPARPAEAPPPPARADAEWPVAPPAPAPARASFDPFGSVPPPAPGARPLMDPFGGPPVQASVPPPVSPSFAPAPRPDPFAPPPQQTTGTRPIAEDLGKPSLARLALPIAGLVVLAVFAALVVALLSPGPPPPEIELITSPPGAQVALDGARISGVTPLTVRDGLVPGQTHRLEVSLPGYGGWAASIQATSGTLRQFIVLSPLPAALRVESEPPGAAITVNGVLRGNAPVQVDTGLFVGQEAEIRASLPGHQPFVQRVSLGEGVTSTRAVLVPAAQ